ncbi:hypothetical protein [Candidatus Agathobaculum pullicola]|uniref:hypothetical protein n=1 Tax=Candidatus Agathobaculum pullicola TaxID=2838426 RepID=UPI003F90E163
MSKEAHRQRLIDSFVNAAYVYDDKILLTFNYQDGQETISLHDVNDSDLSNERPPKRDYLKTIPHNSARRICV